jgi:ATP-binding cassette subfamily C (CFTR/MRP) protein 1
MFWYSLIVITCEFRVLIAHVEDPTEESWKGYFYAGLLFVASVVQTLVLAQYFHRMFSIGMRMRSTLTSILYRKALTMSNVARKGKNEQ